MKENYPIVYAPGSIDTERLKSGEINQVEPNTNAYINRLKIYPEVLIEDHWLDEKGENKERFIGALIRIERNGLWVLVPIMQRWVYTKHESVPESFAMAFYRYVYNLQILYIVNDTIPESHWIDPDQQDEKDRLNEFNERNL